MGRPVAAFQSLRVVVPAAGEDVLAVWAEGHGQDEVCVRKRLANERSSGGIPEPNGVVAAEGEHGLAVGTECDIS